MEVWLGARRVLLHLKMSIGNCRKLNFYILYVYEMHHLVEEVKSTALYNFI